MATINEDFLEMIADARRIVDGVTKWQKEINRVAEEARSAFKQAFAFDRCAFHNSLTGLMEGLERHRVDHDLVTKYLPTRGWYLNGREPCTISLRLAAAIRSEDWEKVDSEVMAHLPTIKTERLENDLPSHTANRLTLFLNHHHAGRYEEATFIGIPLIDELAMHLYEGKTFTTKRNRYTKPELAMSSARGPMIEGFCNAFVQAFGSLQQDIDPTKLADENYWNRHAILHGLMKRPMGIKDSAKCLSAICFLIAAKTDE